MNERVDLVLKLSREILKLEHQERNLRAKRDEKRAELARLLAGDSLPPTPRPDYRPGSVTSKVLHLLATAHPTARSTEAIAAELGIDVATIRSTLSRLKSAHQVESPMRGEYRAVVHDEPQEGGAHN